MVDTISIALLLLSPLSINLLSSARITESSIVFSCLLPSTIMTNSPLVFSSIDDITSLIFPLEYSSNFLVNSLAKDIFLSPSISRRACNVSAIL